MAQLFAAVDNGVAAGVAGVGAVYGVGATAEAAVESARQDSGAPESTYDVVPISSEAAAYVESHGGQPSPVLLVGRRGVELAEGAVR